MGKARAPRSDGLKNQAALLKAADEAFVEIGVDVSISEIAKKSGCRQRHSVSPLRDQG